MKSVAQYGHLWRLADGDLGLFWYPGKLIWRVGALGSCSGCKGPGKVKARLPGFSLGLGAMCW